MQCITLLTMLLASMVLPTSARYNLVQDYSGVNFFNEFDFFTDPDPTQGHVVFKDMVDANATGLAGFIDGGNATNAIYMGVDTKQVAPEGRGSVRVTSKQSYQHFLMIADIVHMPGGICGTWPAFWTVGQDWPNNGEIDILEGVNEQITNAMTLHTAKSIQINNKLAGSFAGSVIAPNCAVDAPDQAENQGCGIEDPSQLTYGTGFNQAGGGVFAVEWTSQQIRMWFFPRGKFPDDIVNSQPSPNPNWGPPRSVFAGDFDMDENFKEQNIVFDTTFCGSWAGPAFAQSSCASLAPTCEDFVSNHPEAFAEAYWAINALQVFQDDGNGNKTSSGASGQPVPPTNGPPFPSTNGSPQPQPSIGIEPSSSQPQDPASTAVQSQEGPAQGAAPGYSAPVRKRGIGSRHSLTASTASKRTTGGATLPIGFGGV